MTRFNARLIHSAFLLAALALSQSACSSSGSNEEPMELVWDYSEGFLGPASWANISQEFAACGAGQQQSPIDIDVDPEDDLPQLDVDYPEEGLDLENDGNRIIFHADGGGDVQFHGIDYDLKSIHFHVPGEHLFKGEEMDGELHFVHEGDGGEIMIVAVWVSDGVINKALSTINVSLPPSPGDRFADAAIRIDLEDLLPEERFYYHYDGSLSEPPCTEGVTWIVLKSPIEAALNQLAVLRNLIGENARPVQPLYGREILQR